MIVFSQKKIIYNILNFENAIKRAGLISKRLKQV